VKLAVSFSGQWEEGKIMSSGMNMRALVGRILVLSSSLILGLAPLVRAADINWGSAQQIMNDNDVSTNGAAVAAYAFNATSAGTVNGVTFQPFAVGNQVNTVGNYTLGVAGFVVLGSGHTTASAPFGSLSSGYQNLLGTDALDLTNTMQLDITGLTGGQNYEIQFWANDSSSYDPNPGFTFPTFIVTGMTSATLDPNTSLQEGGLGQYVTGTFTADPSGTQSIQFFDGEVAFLNGFQLRALSPVAVPTPVAVWGGLGLLPAVWWARRRKTARAD